LRCDRAHRSAIAFQLSTQYAVEIRNGPERLNASMINTKTLALLFVLASSLIGASKDKDVKLDSGTCVRKVFVTGRQTIAVSWANDNLAAKTCMQPVSTPDEAEVILDLEPDREPLTKVQYQPGDSGYSVQCSGSVGATRCVD